MRTIAANKKERFRDMAKTKHTHAIEYPNEVLARRAVSKEFGMETDIGGIYHFTSGTALMMEVFAECGDKIPMSKGTKPMTADFLIVSKLPLHNTEPSAAWLSTLRNISGKLGHQNTIKTVAKKDDRRKLRMQIESSAGTELKADLIKADVYNERDNIFRNFTNDLVPFQDIRHGMIKALEEIGEYDIDTESKALMCRELDDLYKYCKGVKDGINNTVSREDWKNRYEYVDKQDIGFQRKRFDAVMQKNLECLKENTKNPLIMIIPRSQIQQYFDNLVKSAPSFLRGYLAETGNSVIDQMDATNRKVNLKDEKTKTPFAVSLKIETDKDYKNVEASRILYNETECLYRGCQMYYDEETKTREVYSHTASLDQNGAVQAIDEIETAREIRGDIEDNINKNININVNKNINAEQKTTDKAKAETPQIEKRESDGMRETEVIEEDMEEGGMEL